MPAGKAQKLAELKPHRLKLETGRTVDRARQVDRTYDVIAVNTTRPSTTIPPRSLIINVGSATPFSIVIGLFGSGHELMLNPPPARPLLWEETLGLFLN